MIPDQGAIINDNGTVGWLIVTPFGPMIRPGTIEQLTEELECFIVTMENLLQAVRVHAHSTPEQLKATALFTDTWGKLMDWDDEDDIARAVELQDGFLEV